MRRVSRIGLVGAVMVVMVLIVFLAQLGSGAAAGRRAAGVFTGTRSLVRVVTSTVGVENSATRSTAFSRIPGAATTVVIPSGRAVFLIRFSASEWCQGSPSSHCSVIIRVNGQEAFPRAGYNANFDDGGAENPESHAIERAIGPLDAGTYTIEALWSVSNSILEFRMFMWTLVVERLRVS
jgi:hypothetical protein